jgi:proteasome lid subunit RPN8/RPN11
VISDETREQILAHAQNEQPNECCGLVIIEGGREKYVPCANVSPEPRTTFTIDANDYNLADDRGEIIAIIHSHISIPPTPTDADRSSCEATGLPWLIVNPATGEWGGCEPCGFQAPLVGRQHVWGVMDCWTVVRDWYDRERGITLMNVPRQKNFWHRGENPLGNNWKSAGFRALDEGEELEIGDVLLMQTGDSDVPNHVALYLGEDEILHHMENRLSSRDVYGGWYRKHTVMVVRYATDHSSQG